MPELVHPYIRFPFNYFCFTFSSHIVCISMFTDKIGHFFGLIRRFFYLLNIIINVLRTIWSFNKYFVKLLNLIGCYNKHLFVKSKCYSASDINFILVVVCLIHYSIYLFLERMFWLTRSLTFWYLFTVLCPCPAVYIECPVHHVLMQKKRNHLYRL